jgi:hypothetical protein
MTSHSQGQTLPKVAAGRFIDPFLQHGINSPYRSHAAKRQGHIHRFHDIWHHLLEKQTVQSTAVHQRGEDFPHTGNEQRSSQPLEPTSRMLQAFQLLQLAWSQSRFDVRLRS